MEAKNGTSLFGKTTRLEESNACSESWSAQKIPQKWTMWTLLFGLSDVLVVTPVLQTPTSCIEVLEQSECSFWACESHYEVCGLSPGKVSWPAKIWCGRGGWWICTYLHILLLVPFFHARYGICVRAVAQQYLYYYVFITPLSILAVHSFLLQHDLPAVWKTGDSKPSSFTLVAAVSAHDTENLSLLQFTGASATHVNTHHLGITWSCTTLEGWSCPMEVLVSVQTAQQNASKKQHITSCLPDEFNLENEHSQPIMHRHFTWDSFGKTVDPYHGRCKFRGSGLLTGCPTSALMLLWYPRLYRLSSMWTSGLVQIPGISPHLSVSCLAIADSMSDHLQTGGFGEFNPADSMVADSYPSSSAQSTPMPLSHTFTVIASLAETIYNIITQEWTASIYRVARNCKEKRNDISIMSQFVAILNCFQSASKTYLPRKEQLCGFFAWWNARSLRPVLSASLR